MIKERIEELAMVDQWKMCFELKAEIRALNVTAVSGGTGIF
jgi:hypothetical protein